MHDALLLLVALVANVAGMGWLALAMDVHWQQVCGDRLRTSARARRLRVLGTSALAASLVLCLVADHASTAALEWAVALAAAALVITHLPGGALAASAGAWCARRRKHESRPSTTSFRPDARELR